jgi:cytochrome c biogenesis protein CcmG, thiol:disulfide interchange protein DsbE
MRDGGRLFALGRGRIPKVDSMRTLAILIVAAALSAAAPHVHALRTGEAAPALALATASGETMDLARLRGRIVYVDFWASWCTPCRRSFPWMNALLERYRNEGLVIVGVNVDKRRADADRFLRDVPASFPVVFDEQGTTPAAFDVKGMPSSYLIDRHGVVVAIEEGFHDERKADIEARIRALLAQQ